MPFTPTDYLPYDFANRRHIGPSPSEMAHMLETLACPISIVLLMRRFQVLSGRKTFELWKA